MDSSTKPSVTRFIIPELRIVVVVISHNLAYFKLWGKQVSSLKKKKKHKKTSLSLNIGHDPLTWLRVQLGATYQ